MTRPKRFDSAVESLESSYKELALTNAWLAGRLREIGEQWAQEHAPLDLGPGEDISTAIEFPHMGNEEGQDAG